MNRGIADRVAVLDRTFREIASTRMQGVPVLNPAVRVEAVGFEDDGDEGALGVLITPWFMNLVRLPLTDAAAAATPAPGRTRVRRIGEQRLDFIGNAEGRVGPFEACSLFSPMFEFADHEAALVAACEVLGLLRPLPSVTVAQPARRRFLLGRGGERRTVTP
ncbi:MAG: [NiFe]-hydrogenase assembly chaperone HybE [Burkholderiales bacterium]